MAAIATASRKKISEFHMHHLSKLAWASAVLPYPVSQAQPLLTLVLSMVERRLSQMNSPGAHSLLWSIWSSGHPTLVSAEFTKWLQMHVDLSDMSTSVDVLLMDAEWRRASQECLWLSLLKPSSKSGSPQKVVSKCAQMSEVPD